MSRLQAWFARLGLVLLGLFLGLCAAELLARAIAPAGHADLLFNAPDNTPDGLYLIDHDLMLVPAPGFSAMARGLGGSVPLRINSLGLRGAEPEPKQGSRWLAVGDSFTLSTQVREEDSFEALLARQLSTPTQPTEVWNAGVDGYSTWQATGRYLALDPALDADAVLLTFFVGNDLQDNERFHTLIPEARRHAAGSPIPRPRVSPVESWLTRNAYLYAHWRVRSRARALASGMDPVLHQWRDELSIFTDTGQQRLRGLESRTRPALRELAERTRARGDQLLVAVAPPAFVVQRERVASTFEVVGLDPATAALDAPAQLVMETLHSLGIQGCDLTTPLIVGAEVEPMYLTYDGHWTPAGHVVVADALRACLEAG